VVVENVERIMSEEGLPPREAAIKAMGQISGAIVGITLVLIAVFIPLAFFAGSTGNIYRQFSIVMVASISFSAFMALTLTPALCATLLKPVEAGHNHEKKGFFGWFNRTFARSAKSYEGWVARLLKRSVLMIGVYLAVIAGAVVVFRGLPTSFLPTEDQGYFIVNVQLPPGAAKERTLEVMKQVEEAVLPQPEVANMVSVLGFSFSGQGQNAALAFVPLKDWSERKGADSTVDAMTGRIMGMTAGIRDAFVFAVNPPPIPELGNAVGFSFRLQDRAGHGHDALINARNMLLGDAMGLLAGLLWGATTVAIRKTSLSEAAPAKTLFYQMAVASVGLLAFAAATGHHGIRYTPAAVLSVVFQSVVVALTSYLAWFWLLLRYLASRLSILSFMTPLFGVSFGVLILDEPLDAGFVIGAVMVLAGITLVSGAEMVRERLRKRQARRNSHHG